MKKIKELLYSVHQKYLYAALASMLLTLLFAIIDLSSPFFVIVLIAFTIIAYTSARGTKACWWYLLPVGISSLVVQLLLLAILH